jgi:hypothetical protein
MRLSSEIDVGVVWAEQPRLEREQVSWRVLAEYGDQ